MKYRNSDYSQRWRYQQHTRELDICQTCPGDTKLLNTFTTTSQGFHPRSGVLARASCPFSSQCLAPNSEQICSSGEARAAAGFLHREALRCQYWWQVVLKTQFLNFMLVLGGARPPCVFNADNKIQIMNSAVGLLRRSSRPVFLTKLGSALQSTLQSQNSRCCLGQCSASANLQSISPPEDYPAGQTAPNMKPLAPPGLSRTFYKRELPCPPAVAFSSEEGQAIFRDALAAGTMQGFFRLVEQFRTQDEPAYCGLASVAMVLNALAIDPRRAWKGPWRFFHEHMLDCCHPLEKVREEGITLEQAACLARCNGAAVEVYPFGSVSLDEFRDMVIEAASTADHHIVVSYTRRAFLQTGDGHFSPIGGYSPERDMVLILDTARFKYPPHWVRLEELYMAMKAIDPATGQSRGLMRLGLPRLLDSVLFTLDVRDATWSEAFRYAERGTAAAAAGAATVPGATAASVLAAAAAAAPPEAVKKFIAVRMAGNSCNGGVCTQTAAIETFLHELRSLPLYHIIQGAVPLSEQTSTSTTSGSASPNGTTNGDGTVGAVLGNNGTAQIRSADVDIDSTITNQELEEEEDEDHHQHGLSKNATALSSVRPAVPGPLLPERLTMLLLLAPETLLDAVPTEPLKKEVAALLDISTHKVVQCELRYLIEQYRELPAVLRTMETKVPACTDQRCGEPEHVCTVNNSGEEQGNVYDDDGVSQHVVREATAS